jgi:hypothetical protein
LVTNTYSNRKYYVSINGGAAEESAWPETGSPDNIIKAISSGTADGTISWTVNITATEDKTSITRTTTEW